jgi:hypothetical protein
MKNKYVNFITDEHLLSCIANLHRAYLKAKSNVSKNSLYSNKIDTIKLTFDSKFNNIDEEDLIQSEILRQIDKSINNSIGTFHEQILGGINGYELGNLSGFDIRANDNTLFAIFNRAEIYQNIEECIFEKLAKQASIFRKSTCYYVDFLINSSYSEKWIIGNSESSTSHKRVYRISADKFYDLITGQNQTLLQMNNALPNAIKDFLESMASS